MSSSCRSISLSLLGDRRPRSVLQQREGDAGLQPRVVLEDLLDGHQPSVSPGELSFSSSSGPGERSMETLIKINFIEVQHIDRKGYKS